MWTIHLLLITQSCIPVALLVGSYPRMRKSCILILFFSFFFPLAPDFLLFVLGCVMSLQDVDIATTTYMHRPVLSHITISNQVLPFLLIDG